MENNTTTTAAPATSTPNNNTAIPTLTPQTPAPQTLTLREKLDAAENHWLWKLSLRAALLVSAVIATGCLGWAAQNSEEWYFSWGYTAQFLLYFTLITSGITIVWTLICILVLLLRRPPRPVHPGVAVGIDLILWIGYWFTTACAAVACASVLSFGSDGVIGSRYSSSGYYTMASNGTWVYNLSSYNIRYNETRNCESQSWATYYTTNDEPVYLSCAEQDAAVNAMWKGTRHRAGVEMAGTVCQGLCLVLHFILFVWACVDTHRRNKGKTNLDAEKLAANIITKMVSDGAILQAPRPQQPAQQQQQQQQWYQAQGQNQQHLPYTVHQGPPPPLNPQNPARRTQADLPPLPNVVEHYASEKGPRGLGEPGPAQQPIVEHYGNHKGGVAPHAI